MNKVALLFTKKHHLGSNVFDSCQEISTLKKENLKACYFKQSRDNRDCIINELRLTKNFQLETKQKVK